MSTPVYVNVYRLIPPKDGKTKASNDALEFINMGIYHAGVEVLGQEYSFGGDFTGSGDPTRDGIFVVKPKTAVGDFKESVKLGEIKIDAEGVKAVVERLRPEWKAVTYHILKKNCCYFSEAFSKALDPTFDKTFPKYVYKAAGVGGVVVPDAVLSNLTSALAPPGAAPAHLLNKIDQKVGGKVPTGPTAKPRTAAAAPAASSGGMFGMAKGLASTVTDKVKTVAGKDEQSKYKKAFPSQEGGDLIFSTTCHVMHLFRQQPAELFVAEKGVCLGGPNGLALLLPWDKIGALCYGVKIAPTVERMPPTFEIKDSAPSSDPCLMLIGKGATDSAMPLFGFADGIGKSVSGALSKVTGKAGSDEGLEKAFDAIDTQWRKVCKL